MTRAEHADARERVSLSLGVAQCICICIYIPFTYTLLSIYLSIGLFRRRIVNQSSPISFVSVCNSRFVEPDGGDVFMETPEPRPDDDVFMETPERRPDGDVFMQTPEPRPDDDVFMETPERRQPERQSKSVAIQRFKGLREAPDGNDARDDPEWLPDVDSDSDTEGDLELLERLWVQGDVSEDQLADWKAGLRSVRERLGKKNNTPTRTPTDSDDLKTRVDARVARGQYTNTPTIGCTTVLSNSGVQQHCRDVVSFKTLIDKMTSIKSQAEATPAGRDGVRLEQIIKVHANMQFAGDTVIELRHKVDLVLEVYGDGCARRVECDYEWNRSRVWVSERRTMSSLVGAVVNLPDWLAEAAKAAGATLPDLEFGDEFVIHESNDEGAYWRDDVMRFDRKHACTIFGSWVFFSQIEQGTSLPGDEAWSDGVSVTMRRRDQVGPVYRDEDARRRLVKTVRSNISSVRTVLHAVRDEEESGLVGFGDGGEMEFFEPTDGMLVMHGSVDLDGMLGGTSFEESLREQTGYGLCLDDNSAASFAFCGAIGGIASDGCTNNGRSVSVDQAVAGEDFLLTMKVCVALAMIGRGLQLMMAAGNGTQRPEQLSR